MKFKELDEPIYTSEVWYDLFDGGYIDPAKMLEDPEDIAEIEHARDLLQWFINEAQSQGALELG